MLWIPSDSFVADDDQKMYAAGLSRVSSLAEAVVSVFETKVPKPEHSEVLVKVEGSSMNHLDLLWHVLGSKPVWNTAESYWRLFGGFPKILGMDLAGTVVDVGPGVRQLSIGDKVWAMNAREAEWDGKVLGGLTGHAWARYVTVNEGSAGLMPSSLNFTEAGALPLVAQTSLKALKLLGAPWSGNVTVLILGSTGGTGHVAIQLAKAMGATTVIATGSAIHSDFVKSLGADRFIDYHTEDWWNASVVSDFSVDAVYDTVLQEGTGDRAFQKLKDHGRYVTLCAGIPSCGAPLPTFTTTVSRPTVRARRLRCISGTCASAAALDELRSYVDARMLRVHLDAITPLASIQHGIDLISSHHVVGKVAVTMDGVDDPRIIV